jgi:hypothetical protein
VDEQLEQAANADSVPIVAMTAPPARSLNASLNAFRLGIGLASVRAISSKKELISSVPY